MKRTITFILALLTVLGCALTFSGCSSAPDISEVRDELSALIEASYAVNDIFFGRGLKTEIEVSGLPTEYTPEIENAENYFSDEQLLTQIYSPVVSSYVNDDGETVVQYSSIAEIKAAAEKVYSTAYLEKVYRRTFYNDSSEADGYYHTIKARYREDEEETGYDKDGNPVTETVFRKYNFIEGTGRNYVDSGKEPTKYDLDSMKIVKPSNSTTLVVEISAYYPDYVIVTDSVSGYDDWHSELSGYSWHTIKLYFVKEASGWRIDGPTY